MTRLHSRGLTLTEILIVVAIVAILAAIAYPSYVDQVRKSRRTDATSALEWTSQRLERCYSRLRAYNSLECEQVSAGPTVDTVSEEGHYRITSADPTPGGAGETLAAESYSLYAAPASDQDSQAGDRNCALFRLDSSGLRFALDANDNDSTRLCW